MDLQIAFQTVLNSYLHSKKMKTVVDKEFESFSIVENKIPQKLSQIFHERDFKIKGSVGAGRWADVPWIGIFNPQITVSAQKGYYVCFLFSQDMEFLYLTIIHSITKEDGKNSLSKTEIKNLIESKRDILKREIKSVGYQLNTQIEFNEPKNLGDSPRPKKYAESTIAYLKYPSNQIPSEKEIIADLNGFIELYDLMAGNIVESINDSSDEKVNLEKQDAYSLVPHIQNYIKSKGFNYSEANIKNLYLSLRSKPFVIISGISGTGKTKIVQLFAESIGATEENGQFTLIPVRPDWSDGSELLGYKDIKGEFIEGQLAKVIREAGNNEDRPYFVLLDEMNLARVEYYFSDVLSIMESRRKDGNAYTSSTLVEIEGEKLTLPNNLYIIGTVNMDETTHPFSKKVLDRANTIEFNEIHLTDFSFLNKTESGKPIQLANRSIEASFVQLKDCFETNEDIVEYVSNELTNVNKIIEPLHAHVGYRVRDEICFYMIYNKESALFERNQAFDYCLMQKVLPRLAGSGLKIGKQLEQLFEHFTGTVYANDEMFDATGARYPLSAKKVHAMLGRLRDDGFTSFWIS